MLKGVLFNKNELKYYCIIYNYVNILVKILNFYIIN